MTVITFPRARRCAADASPSQLCRTARLQARRVGCTVDEATHVGAEAAALLAAGERPAAVIERADDIARALVRQRITNVVTAVVAEIIGAPPESLAPNTTLRSMGADRVDVLDICLEIEKRLGANIALTDPEHWAHITIGGLAAQIQCTVTRA